MVRTPNLDPPPPQERLMIQPSDSEILGARATWFLHKPREKFNRIRVRQYRAGLCDCLLGMTTPVSHSVIS